LQHCVKASLATNMTRAPSIETDPVHVLKTGAFNPSDCYVLD
jgi:hypothetical protein